MKIFLEDFFKPKIIYAEISQEPKFCYDISNNFIPEATSFLMTGSNLDYLYILLHSKPITYFFKQFYAGGGLGGNGYRYKKAFMENLPIPKLINSKEQNELLSKLPTKPIYNDKEINSLIGEIYHLNQEEINFIVSQ